MEREQFVIESTQLGSIAVSMEAIAQIVGQAAAESYGVVALAGRGRLSRLIPWGIKKGVDVEQRNGELAVELHIVVEHGLKLAEVAATVRSRVQYELERMLGVPIAALEVHIDGVRSS
ncbi:MAG: Asp23/Gls24 family envelope stress response protein [Gaiellaceae bacterium]